MSPMFSFLVNIVPLWPGLMCAAVGRCDHRETHLDAEGATQVYICPCFALNGDIVAGPNLHPHDVDLATRRRIGASGLVAENSGRTFALMCRIPYICRLVIAHVCCMRFGVMGSASPARKKPRSRTPRVSEPIDIRQQCAASRICTHIVTLG